MGYSDAKEFAILGGGPAYDILSNTPGTAGPLQKGKSALDRAGEALKLANKVSPFQAPFVADAITEKVGADISLFFGRGVYLIVGVIFLIIGLVMLSRPVREGIGEGVRDALSE